MLRIVWLSAAKELTRLRRDPFSLAIPIGMPLILGGLMNVMFGGGGQAVPQGRLLVADEDNTVVSGALTAAFGRPPLNRMVRLENVPQAEGRARLDRGEASALLVIPRGMQAAYLDGRPFRLQLINNPAQRILPKIIEESLSIVVDGGFYVQRVAGEQLRAFRTGQAPSDPAVAASSVAINRLMTRLRKYIDPPLIELETAVVAERKQTQSFGSLFFPGMIFMALMFIANTMAIEIWREQMQGTLRRLAMTPAPLGAFLAGRVLVVALVIAGVGIAGLAAMRWLVAVPVANTPAAILWLVFAGTVFYLLLLVASLHASNRRAANVVGNMVVFPLMLLGGTMFPFEAMPDWMARIGRLTPNGWAVTQFKAILAGTAQPRELLAAIAGLIVVSALAYAVALRRMRRGFLV